MNLSEPLSMQAALSDSAGGVLLRVRVQPRSSRNAVEGVARTAEGVAYIRVRLTAPPVDGKANEACVKFLAKVLGTSPSQLTLVAGETSRLKTILVSGSSLAEVRQRLESVG